MSDLDQDYIRIRTDTRDWQAAMMTVAQGGTGTASDPATELRIGKPPDGPGGSLTQPAAQPQAGADESLAPPMTPSTGEFPTEPPVTKALKMLGGKGKQFAEAIHPGLVTAAKAIGMDDEQANTMATGLTEFVAGLPGPDEEDQTAGLETGAAVIPGAGLALKMTKGAKRAEKAAATAAHTRIPTWEEAVKIDEYQRAFDDRLKTFADRLSEQRRGVRSDVQVTTDSISPEALSMEQYLQLPPGTIAKDSDVVAIKRLFKEIAEPTRLLAKYVAEHPTDSPAFLALLEQLPKVDDGLRKIAGVYAETGRSQRLLSSTRPTTGMIPADSAERVRIADPYLQQWLTFFQQQDQLARMGAPALTPEKMASALAELKSDEEMVKLLTAMDRPSRFDLFLEYWVNGLLSGPQTHATNMLSNAATIAWGVPERALAGLYSRQVRPSEFTAMMGGIVESFGDAMRLAWKGFKEETPQFGAGKLDTPRRAITADALELTGPAGRAVDLLGATVRLPGRALMAEDDFFKAIAFRAELRALARRESVRQVADAGLSGATARARRKAIETEILAHPAQFPEIDQAAKDYASYVTFTRDLGENGQKVQAALSTPVGRIVVPFVRTPTNIFKFFGERTPLAFASTAVREEIAAGGERRALALAKISMGSMVMGYFGMLASEGLVTGGGPKDKALRQELMQTGWQPYSFKVGDTYYQYARIEPLGSLIGLAADAADLLGQLPRKDAEELATALTVAISRNLAQKTFVKGLAGTLNAVSSQDLNIVQTFFEKELPTILPASTAMSQVTRLHDPVMREVHGIVDAFKAKIPGLSDTLPPRRNLWGEPIHLDGGLGPDLISPIYTSSKKLDPVSEELVRLELPVEMPMRQIDRVPLAPQEYDAFVVLAGGKPILGEMTLKQRLADVMHSDLYQRASGGPQGGKADLVRQWVTTYRERAKQILDSPADLKTFLGRDDVKDLRAARATQRAHESMKFNAPKEAR